MDSIKDAMNKEQKQKVYCSPKERDADMVSPTLYVAVEEPEVSSAMMDYRNSATIVSPQEQPKQMSPEANDFPVHRDEGQPVEIHWTQLNVQPPGSTICEASAPNSIAAELLEEISAQGIADKGTMSPIFEENQGSNNLVGISKMRGMRRMAGAYINHLANKVKRKTARKSIF